MITGMRRSDHELDSTGNAEASDDVLISNDHMNVWLFIAPKLHRNCPVELVEAFEHRVHEWPVELIVMTSSDVFDTCPDTSTHEQFKAREELSKVQLVYSVE